MEKTLKEGLTRLGLEAFCDADEEELWASG